jgi:hypothetical protein
VRPKSKKTAAIDRKLKPIRQGYLVAHPCCHCCGGPTSDTHEIVRGANRSEAKKHPGAWLSLCRPCHELFGDYSLWPPARQCALKMLADPQTFSLELIQDLRGDNLVMLSDVVEYLELK